MLQWAREHDCPWDILTCTLAARYGHLEVLQWAREHGCPWSAETSTAAARGGHLSVLRWARDHDCPWDWMTCYFRRSGRAPGGAEVGAGARLPVVEAWV